MAARTSVTLLLAIAATLQAVPALGDCIQDANQCFMSCSNFNSGSPEQSLCRVRCHNMWTQCHAAKAPEQGRRRRAIVNQFEETVALPIDNGSNNGLPQQSFSLPDDHCKDYWEKCWADCSVKHPYVGSQQNNCRSSCYEHWQKCARKAPHQVNESEQVQRRSADCLENSRQCFSSCNVYKNSSSEQFYCRRGCYDMQSRCVTPKPTSSRRPAISNRRNKRRATISCQDNLRTCLAQCNISKNGSNFMNKCYQDCYACVNHTSV